MRFIVTGGAGFIGSHLVEFLFKDGHEVIVIDNLHTGSINNLKGLDAEIVEGRVKTIKEIKKDVDGIFHLGIPSSSPMYRRNPNLIHQAMEDFLNVMEYAREKGCRVVLASTSSIYNGNPTPWNEDMRIYPTDFYTETRYSMERLAKVYKDLYDVETIVLRLFSVYGEREEYKEKYANLISQFTWSILKDEPPVIYGDGTQTRDFIYVKDVVNAFWRAFKAEKIKYDIFNVGRGESYSLNEIVKMINEEVGKNIEPKYVENPLKNYVYHTLADTRKAERKLGFKAKTSVREGIKKVVSYYQQKSSLPLSSS